LFRPKTERLGETIKAKSAVIIVALAVGQQSQRMLLIQLYKK